jgi:tRNA(His) 5'-end guanylyltransferase
MIKLTSILASAATMYFNMDPEISLLGPQQFDCRFFSVPNLSEATNYILWRMRDCSRNSILSVAQHYLSHKKMQGKKCSELLDILFTEKQVIWEDDFSIREQRGSLILPIKRKCQNLQGEYERNYMTFMTPTPNLEELSHAERIAILFPEA